MSLASIVRRRVTNPWNSDASTTDTISEMSRIVREQVYSPAVIAAAADAIAPLPSCASDREKLCAVYFWIKRRLRFTTDPALNAKFFRHVVDPEEIELLILPESLVTSTDPQGDCDDFSLLGATLLWIVGLPTRFVTVAADSQYPGEFSHVYLEVLVNGTEWVPFDASHGSVPGWEYGNITRRQSWPITTH